MEIETSSSRAIKLKRLNNRITVTLNPTKILPGCLLNRRAEASKIWEIPKGPTSSKNPRSKYLKIFELSRAIFARSTENSESNKNFNLPTFFKELFSDRGDNKAKENPKILAPKGAKSQILWIANSRSTLFLFKFSLSYVKLKIHDLKIT
jgi:hypothetical protein